MSKRATTLRSVKHDSVLQRLPPRFRPNVDIRALGSELVDLMYFRTGERNVVTSSDLRRALGQRGNSKLRLVAVAYDFTREAEELVASRGGLTFSERRFPEPWTDQSWASVRQRK